MSLDQHIAALNTKFAEVDATIAREQLRPQPDAIRLQSLKRRKLKLKEELVRRRAKHL